MQSNKKVRSKRKRGERGTRKLRFPLLPEGCKGKGKSKEPSISRLWGGNLGFTKVQSMGTAHREYREIELFWVKDPTRKANNPVAA